MQVTEYGLNSILAPKKVTNIYLPLSLQNKIHLNIFHVLAWRHIINLMLITFFLKVFIVYISSLFPMYKIKQPQSFHREKVEYVIIVIFVLISISSIHINLYGWYKYIYFRKIKVIKSWIVSYCLIQYNF